MDLNTILCVGRRDMYGIPSCVPKQQFHPVVASFKMDSLRNSVRKDKPESRSSSRRSSNSPGSPSKSILRGQICSPNHGSPTGSRNVRFTESQANRDSSWEFSKIHVNETTQTNGQDSQTTADTAVQVYSTSGDDARVVRPFMKSNHHPMMGGMNFQTPATTIRSSRNTGDRSPVRNYGRSRSPEYVIKQQRELPRTPGHRIVENKVLNQGINANQQKVVGPTAVRKDHPRSNLGRPGQKRLASATQTPTAPSGQKIIQNMNFGVYEQAVPRENVKTRKLDILDGRKIIQNMDLGKLPTEKSIGIQTQTDIGIPTERVVQRGWDFEVQTPIVQTGRDVEVQTPRDASVQTPRDQHVQTADDVSSEDSSMIDDTNNVSHAYAQTGDEEDSRDVGVQTPRDQEVQTTNDASSEDSSMTEATNSVSHAYAQTDDEEDSQTDDEEDSRDVGVQTPRDVGVQTPREVSIQTSDTSDEEEDSTVATQTPSESDSNRILQNMDIYTNVWSNTKNKDLSSGVDDDRRMIDNLPKLSFKDMLTEVSDDEEVDLPPHLTEPFPQRGPVYVYDKLKASAAGTATGHETEPRPGGLIEHSAKQLLERETRTFPRAVNLSPQRKGKSDFKNKAKSARLSPSTNGAFSRKETIPFHMGSPKRPLSTTTNAERDHYQGKHNFNISHRPQDKYDAGTQFHSEYHLDLQAKEDRIKELAETLDFTPIETHSFDPGSKVKIPPPLPVTVPDFSSDSQENQLRNAFIKGVDLGPIPMAREDRYDNRLTDYSPPRQKLVKSVNFDSSIRDRYRDNVGPNYIFFKDTGYGSKYETFEPQPRQTARRPHSSYMSPPRTALSKSRPSSASATPRQSYGSKTNYLTPALSHMRKQAIRKSVTDNPWNSLISKAMPSSSCQRSDTFICSTKPAPQPLTLPLADAAPSLFPGSRSHDAGSFETVGNQPRYVADLNSTSNCRPEPKRKSRTPSPSIRLPDQNKRIAANTSAKVPNPGNQRGLSSTSKPPLPRGRATKKSMVKQAPRNASSDTRRGDSRGASGVNNSQPRSRSVDSAKHGSRDRGTSTTNRGHSSSREINSNRVTAGKVIDGQNDKEWMFLGNEAIQKIIEKANL